MSDAAMGLRLGIDIGGTFTDFALVGAAGGAAAIHKRLTTPDDPSRAVIEGVAELLDRTGVGVGDVSEVVHGTTLVTNAIIERRGAVTGMLTTEGFRDVLDMRQEKRYDVFDLRITFPEPVVARPLRREVRERVRYDGSIAVALDLDAAEAAVRDLVERHRIEALAICLLHAYANPAHEDAIRERVEACFPDLSVSTSSEVHPERREFERFTTTCLNAFTRPMFDRYLARLEDGLAGLGFRGRLYVMSSSGGTLAPATARRLPVRVVESGPAAGVRMSVFHGRALGVPDLLSFDMGGTTAKGALVRGGEAMKVYALEVARQHEFKAGSGLPVRTPVIDMIEIGAGGGSIAAIDARGTIAVGPRSAGADPGPACYARGGGDPTLTDANVVLGYLDPAFFLGGDMRLDAAAAARAVERGVAAPLGLTLERAAWGIHDVVSEDVARAFRVHASERGFDYRTSTMVAFGGSGPAHALSVARKLRIPRVVFPVAAGVMSAFGLLASPLAFEVARSGQRFVRDLAPGDLGARFAPLEAEARAPLRAAGLGEADMTVIRRVDMRYHGQGHEIEVTLPDDVDLDDLVARLPDLFRRRYEALYAFAFLDSPLVVTTWKVEVRGPEPSMTAEAATGGGDAAAARKGGRRAFFPDAGGWVDAPVYDRYALAVGERIAGPALVEERESTVVIGPGDACRVGERLDLVADLQAPAVGVARATRSTPGPRQQRGE